MDKKKSHWWDYSNMHKHYWEYNRDDDDLEVVWGSSPTRQEIESGWMRLPGAEELARNRITRVQNPIYKHNNTNRRKKREIEEDDYIEPSQNRRSPQRILSPTTILKGYLSPVKLIEFDSSPFTPSTPEDLKQIIREWEEDKKLWNK